MVVSDVIFHVPNQTEGIGDLTAVLDEPFEIVGGKVNSLIVWLPLFHLLYLFVVEAFGEVMDDLGPRVLRIKSDHAMAVLNNKICVTIPFFPVLAHVEHDVDLILFGEFLELFVRSTLLDIVFLGDFFSTTLYITPKRDELHIASVRLEDGQTVGNAMAFCVGIDHVPSSFNDGFHELTLDFHSLILGDEQVQFYFRHLLGNTFLSSLVVLARHVPSKNGNHLVD